ncbi:unnamed protein product [Cylindrotheca closterium]|uniref:SHSP domain-containing protein n=1 Tax=Cylindrotheca closterium TaxID=2856 RepID=A0AAD2GEU1_9STRA|nr:unnamed protein product [Cylindrotheca closterium]
MQFYFQHPCLLNDPRLKDDIYAPRQRRRNSGYYHSAHSSTSPPAVPFLDQQVIMEEIMKNKNRHRQQQHPRQHRETPVGTQDDGFEFIVFPPHGMNNRRRSNNMNDCKRDDFRMPCQTPSPAPTSKQPTAATNLADPFFEMVFAGAPSQSRERQQPPERPHQAPKQEKKAAPNPVDPLLELLFSNAPSANQERPQQQPKQEKNSAAPQTIEPLLELLFSNAASGKPRRRQHSPEEATLLNLLNAQQRAQKEQDKTTQATNEQPKTVTFGTVSDNHSNTNAVYQLPQQWHIQATDQALILSIDVAGFGTNDLNLQVDPIRRRSNSISTMQLTLKAKRTNALGQIWELERTKTLDANLYKVNAVEASCDDDILQITIPKKTIQPTTRANGIIPIRASRTPTTTPTTTTTTQEAEQEEKTQDEEEVKLIGLPDFLAAMAAQYAEEQEEKDEDQKEEMTSVPISLEHQMEAKTQLEALAAEFKQAYEAALSKPSSAVNDAKDDSGASVGVKESNQVTLQEKLDRSNSGSNASNDSRNEDAPTAESVVKPVASSEGVTQEKEGIVESEEATASSMPDLIADTSENEVLEVKREDSSNGNYVPVADHCLAETIDHDIDPKLESNGESFDVVDSKEENDNESWEDVSAKG